MIYGERSKGRSLDTGIDTGRNTISVIATNIGQIKKEQRKRRTEEASYIELWKQLHKRNKALEGKCYRNLEP